MVHFLLKATSLILGLSNLAGTLLPLAFRKHLYSTRYEGYISIKNYTGLVHKLHCAASSFIGFLGYYLLATVEHKYRAWTILNFCLLTTGLVLDPWFLHY